jgi:antitoxin CptB
MVSEQEYKRIAWASRRGMLELDLILVPFVEHCFRDLSEPDQQRFISLLEEQDNDLFAWFLGHKRPNNPDLSSIVEQIMDHARKPT